MDKYLVQLTAPTGNTAEHIATAQPTQLAGTKRKSTDAYSNLPTIDLDDYDVLDGHPMDSCTVVRGKINRLLEAGEMKIGQFCDAIGVSGNAYRRYLSECLVVFQEEGIGWFEDPYKEAKDCCCCLNSRGKERCRD
jgi:hypothetical protein